LQPLGKPDQTAKSWLVDLDVAQVMIDTATVGAIVAVWISDQKVIWFHFLFLAMVASAFRVTLTPLLLRALPVTTIVMITLVRAWAADELPADEIFELPILGLMIAVVYLTSSRRSRLANEVEANQETIKELHAAARRELQDQLVLSQRLQVSNRLNTAAIHDVNNTLARMRIAAETLVDHPDQAERVAATGTEIERYTEEAGLIARELLTAARMVNTLSTDVPGDLGNCLTQFEPLLKRLCRTDIVLVVARAEQNTNLALPRLRLQQILANLVANAVDAMPEPGQIEISARFREEVGIGEIRVTDTGTGMDDSTLQRIFEPYYTTKSAENGTGMGLYAVRELLTAVNGTISVQSRIGLGTTVILEIPGQDPHAAHDDQSPAHEPTSEARAGRQNALHILLAEDDALYRGALADALRAAGHQVTAVTNGMEAADELVPGHDFDALVSDIDMPGRGGTELVGLIEQLEHRPVVVLITGADVEPGPLPQAVAVRFRRKPFATADLLTDLQVLIKG